MIGYMLFLILVYLLLGPVTVWVVLGISIVVFALAWLGSMIKGY